jgi:hypothetical protein
LEPMRSITWPLDTSKSRSYETLSPEKIAVRSGLIAQGITEYHRCDYIKAYNCFRDAYGMGPVNIMSSPVDKVADDTLKA